MSETTRATAASTFAGPAGAAEPAGWWHGCAHHHFGF